MHAGGGEAEQGVARPDVAARQQSAALRRAHREAGEVVVLGGVHARHLRRFAAHQGAARPGGSPSAIPAITARACSTRSRPVAK
jgi:hypothetical protein